MQDPLARIRRFDLSVPTLLRFGRLLFILFLGAILLFAFRYRLGDARFKLETHIDHVANAACAHSLLFERHVKSDVKWSVADAITTGLPVLVPAGIFMRLFGENPASPQLAMLFLNLFWVVALLIVVFRFQRAVFWDITMALMLTVAPYSFSSWTLVMGELPCLMMLVITFALLPHAKDRRFAAASGAMFALAVATKLIAVFALAPIAVYFAMPLLRDKRRPDVESISSFFVGVLAVAVTVSVLRLYLSGGFHAYAAYAGRFFGSYARWTALQGRSGPAYVVNFAMKKNRFLENFGGYGVVLSLLSIGGTAVVQGLRSHAIDRRTKEFGVLLLSVTLLPMVFWFFFDPWLWSIRRITPSVFCGILGIACFVSALKNRPLQFLLLATFLLGFSKTSLFAERSGLLDVRTAPDRELVDFNDLCAVLDKAMTKDGHRTVIGYRREPPLMLKVSPLRFEDATERIFSLQLTDADVQERISAHPSRFAVRIFSLPIEEFPGACQGARRIYQNSTFQLDQCEVDRGLAPVTGETY